jgi:hypothetical protein
MLELEVRGVGGNLCPQAEDAEPALPDVGVVEQHDGRVGELRSPAGKVVADRLVAVKPVDVQQVDRAIREIGHRLGEGGSDEPREGAIAGIVIGGEIGENRLAVVPGMGVADPAVDPVAAGSQPEPVHRLAPSAIGNPRRDPQLDDAPRAQRVDQPEGERHVLDPCRFGEAIREPECRLRQQRIRFREDEALHVVAGCRESRARGAPSCGFGGNDSGAVQA